MLKAMFTFIATTAKRMLIFSYQYTFVNRHFSVAPRILLLHVFDVCLPYVIIWRGHSMGKSVFSFFHWQMNSADPREGGLTAICTWNWSTMRARAPAFTSFATAYRYYIIDRVLSNSFSSMPSGIIYLTSWKPFPSLFAAFSNFLNLFSSSLILWTKSWDTESLYGKFGTKGRFSRQKK